jgi:hypothetical protein
MTARWLPWALVLLWPGAVAAAEPDARAAQVEATEPSIVLVEHDAPGVVGGHLDVHGGATTAPFAAPSLREVSGHAIVAVAGGYGRVAGPIWIGARLPLVLGSVRQPAGSYVDEAAWGNPEAFAEHRLQLRRRSVRLSAATRLSIGAPLAGAGSDEGLLERRSLAIADALHGWSERALFAPATWPVTVSTRVTVDAGRWSAQASAKAPFFFRVADPPHRSGIDAAGVGFTPSLGLAGAAWVTRGFGVSLATHLVVDAVPPLAWQDDPSPLQLSLQPGLHLRLGTHAWVRAELLAPIAGALAGDTLGGGLGVAGFL